ncbi:hypothetical protein LPJ66_004066 [Kickxella alabastrina]|uniref:Uncharacterized protein n=1 Tax=Kickxella alabastrina TaxID=61397 RepID=A0ACC1IJP5_9FUNG|nr:hypothetical protein LPJ66_004066 [Kickxella alabastrina]
MFAPDPDALAATAKTLIDRAQHTPTADPTAIASELRQVLDGLVQAVQTQPPSDHSRTLEYALQIITHLLTTATLHSSLINCGIQSTVQLLRTMPAEIADTPSQGCTDRGSIQGAQALDVCFGGLSRAYEIIDKRIQNDPGGIAETLQLAAQCTECICQGLARLSGGIQQSQVIWKSALENTAPLALHLVKICECSARLYAHCASPIVRRQQQQQQCVEQCAQLKMGVCRLVDLTSAVFRSEAHLTGDSGMKRSLMERYISYVLGTHRLMLGSPPQFKAQWQTICAIATQFSAPAFDSSAMCLRVYKKSCESVRTWCLQSLEQWARAGFEAMQDEKLARRLKTPLAYIRFVVFQMPSLIARISVDAPQWVEVVSCAMAMLDVVFGRLSDIEVLAGISKDVAKSVRQLAVLACSKFTVALFSHSLQPVTQYAEKLARALGDVDRPGGLGASRIPLLDGLQNPAAHREILRIVVENLSSFTAHQQEMLLCPPNSSTTSIVQAFVLAVDRDPASMFVHCRADSDQDREEPSEYEDLVVSASLGASRLSPALFALWENSTLLAILSSSQGGLGAQTMVDAWLVLAEHALPRSVILSSIGGIMEVVAADDLLSFSDAQRELLRRLLAGFLAQCMDDEREQVLGNVVGQYYDNSHSKHFNSWHQRLVDSSLIIAAALTTEHFAQSAEILRQISGHLFSPVLGIPQSSLLLARFAGSFLDARMSFQLDPVVPQLTQVFAHLLRPDSAWIVRHEALVRITYFATQSEDSTIFAALIPEDMYQVLMSYIRRSSDSDISIALLDMYRSAFDLQLPRFRDIWNTCSGASSNGHHAATGAGKSAVAGIVDSARALIFDLNSLGGPLPDSPSANAFRSELTQLARTIERCLSDL